MATIARLVTELSLDDKLTSDLTKVQGKLKSVGQSMRNVGKAATLGLTLPIVAAGTAAVKFATDQAESINKVNEVFGDNANVITDWSKTSAKSFGLSQAESLEAAGTLGNLFKGVGIANDELPAFSQNIVQTAADLGSFNNVNPAQVLEDLRSGLVGETEPLRKYGILLNESTVKQKAMELGLVGANGELTEAAKVQARYALILEQTGDAQGDFARTSDGLANKSRILRAQLKDLGAQFGEILLPFVTKLANALGNLLSFFQRLPTPVRVAIFFLAGLLAAIGPLLIVVGAMASGLAALLPILASLGVGLLPLLGPIALVVAALAALGLAWQFNLFGVRDRLTEFASDVQSVYERLRAEGFSPLNASIRATGSALEDLTGIENSAFVFRLAETADILALIGGAVIRQSIEDLRFALLLLPPVFDQIERDAEVAFDILRASVLLTATDVQVAFLILRASVAETIAILDRFGGALINVGLHLLGFGLGVSLAFLAAKAAIQLFLSDIATLTTVGQGLFNVGVALAQSLIDGWTARIALFAVTLAILGQWALLTVGTVSAALFDAGVSLVQGLSDGFGAGSKLFAVTLAAVGIWAFAQVGTVSSALYQKGVDLVQGVIDGWVDAAKRLALTLAGLGPWAAAQVGTLSGTLYDAGVSLVGGLEAGIIAGIPGLQSAVSRVNGIIEGIIDFVMPGSPSRLMLPVGESMPWGLAVGIQRRMGLLNRAVGGMNAAIGFTPRARVPGISAPGMGATGGGMGGRGFANYGTINVYANDPEEFTDQLRSWSVGGGR